MEADTLDLFREVNGVLVARQARDEGIAIVSGHNKAWMERAFELFADLRQHFGESLVTGEDLRNYLTNRGVQPKHPNAWGAFTNTAAKRGLIARSGQYAQMKDKQSHARETPLWRLAMEGKGA